jgi:hypothetical protein
MNRQRRAERVSAPDDYARALCLAGSERLRQRILAAVEGGASPRDTMGLVRDTAHGVEVATCARHAMLAALDATPDEDSARIAAGLRRRVAADGWFPVVLFGRTGTCITAIRFHRIAPGGHA